MAAKQFAARQFEDFTILDEAGKTVGHLRVKPTGVMWSRSKKKGYLGVSLEKFARFMEENGARKTK